jgi:hypothetical protein
MGDGDGGHHVADKRRLGQLDFQQLMRQRRSARMPAII